jgi:hypothetical protein
MFLAASSCTRRASCSAHTVWRLLPSSCKQDQIRSLLLSSMQGVRMHGCKGFRCKAVMSRQGRSCLSVIH